MFYVTCVISNFTYRVIQKFRPIVIYLLFCKYIFFKNLRVQIIFKINQIQNQLIKLMNFVNDRLSRQRLQINIYKFLISTIVFAVIVFLITDEGFFIGLD